MRVLVITNTIIIIIIIIQRPIQYVRMIHNICYMRNTDDREKVIRQVYYIKNN